MPSWRKNDENCWHNRRQRRGKDLGARIIDCDAVYHDLLENSAEMAKEVGEAFPGSVIDGKIYTKEIGKIVFSDESELARLNAITHRFVGMKVDEILDAHRSRGGWLAAIDAIALIESGLAEKCDFTVAVIAPLEDRVKRLTARDKITEEYARLRISAQKSDDFFREKCTYCLENAGLSKIEFEEKAIGFFKEILEGGSSHE